MVEFALARNSKIKKGKVWPADAAAILEGLAAGPETPTERESRAAVQACVDAVYGHCELSAEKAGAALDSQQLGDFHARVPEGEVAGEICGDAGRREPRVGIPQQ